ncbi:ABC transporter permease [Flavitalea flava]
MLRSYLRITGRYLSRNKIYTSINVLGLALGICSCLVIFLITRFEFGYDRFHPDKERIYRIVGDHLGDGGEHHKFGYVTDPMAMAARAELSGFETVAGFYNYYAKVTIRNNQITVKQFEAPKWGTPSDIVVAEPQYFELFKYRWLAGNPATALNEPFKVVLTEKEAQKYFGEGSPDQFVGRQIAYNDSLLMTVSGIVKDWTQNTDLNFKDFISVSTVAHSSLKNDIDLSAWGMWNSTTQVFVKLAKGVSPAQVERQFPKFLAGHSKKEWGNKTKLALQPLSDLHFNADYTDEYARKAHLPTLYMLLGIAGFILVIAAINFINLSTAQSIQRIREIGVRKVLGSSRGLLIVQFLGETFILTCLAVFISILLVNPVLTAFRAYIPDGVYFYMSDPYTLIFLLGLTLFTSLLAGFYPAKVLSSYLPALSLKGQGLAAINQKSYLRRSLIVFQFTVSLLFIIATLIVGDQIHFMLNKDMGFKKDAIINLQTGWKNPDKKKVLEEKISALPEVSLVCTSEGTPAATGHRGTDLVYQGKTQVKLKSEMHIADENFVPLYELRLMAGRNLHHSDTMTEVLLNEASVRGLGFKKPEDAIGQMVESGQKDRMGQGKLPIVGIVADFHSKSLHERVSPVFITSNSEGSRVISVKLATRNKGAADFKTALEKIEKFWKEVYPDEKFEYSFFDETIATFYSKEQKTVRIIDTAMFISIFISCMGLFGLITFTAKQRTREIGIRKVMGASVSGIVYLLSRDFVKLVVIAILIASPLAYYFMQKWLQDFAYRVTVSLWTFVMAGMAALFIALVTVSFQAIKTARSNPVNSLRAD